MRWLLLVLLAPSLALAAGPRIASGSGTITTGPRILGEPSFAFEFDALTQAETSRPGWPVTTTRAGGATCIGGGTVAANVACVGTYGLESFASGNGGRTAADKHTVSTAGWSTASGDLVLQFRPVAAPTGSVRVIVDTRDVATGNNGWGLYLNSNGQLVLETYAAGVGSTSSAVPTMMALGITYTLRAPLSGTGSLCVDSACIAIALPPPGSHAAVAALGSNRNNVNLANGSIRLLRVSQ